MSSSIDMIRPKNFRDVARSLSAWVSPPPFPLGRLMRGGKFDTLSSLEELGSPRTILNLRRGPDPDHLDVSLRHVPALDSMEIYDMGTPKVRRWLGEVLDVLVDPDLAWPVYMHCTSGRDRTGVVAATVLMLLDVPEDAIVREYMLSDGADRGAIVRGIRALSAAKVSSLVDVSKLRRALRGDET